MSDTARLQVSIEARNQTGPGLDAFRRDIEAAGVSVQRISVATNQAGESVVRFQGTASAAIQATQRQVERDAQQIAQSLGRIAGVQRVQVATPQTTASAQALAAEQRALDQAAQARTRATALAERDAARFLQTQERANQQALDSALRAIERETDARARAAAKEQADAARVAQAIAAQQATQTAQAALIRERLGAGGTVQFQITGLSPEALQRLQQQLRAVGVEAEQLTARVSRAGQTVRTLQLTPGRGGVDPLGLVSIERTLAGATLQSVQFTSSLSRGLQGATREMSALAQGIGHGLGLFSSFGAGIGTAVVTAAIVGGIAKTATAFGEFDRQVRGTNALLDLTGDAAERSFGRMQQDARASGVALGIGATNAVKGLYDTISAGIPVGREAFQVLTVSSKAAVGGLTDTATAADGLTSVLNAYRLSTSQAERVSDQMFQTVNIGKITFSQLSQGIGTVVPLAAALGVNFAEVGGTIATATQQGLRSGQAIEGLRAALQAFLKPSEDASKVAASLGVGFDAATVKSKGFNQALTDVVRATGGSEALLGRLFGDVQAINFALAVSGQNAPATARAIEQIGTASGTTARAAAQVELSLGRAFERTRAQAEDVGLSVGQLASGPLTSLLNVATGIGQALNTWPKSVPETAQARLMRDLAEATGTLNEQTERRQRNQQREQFAGQVLGRVVDTGVAVVTARRRGGGAQEIRDTLAAQQEAQQSLNALLAAGSIEQLQLNRARDSGSLSEVRYQAATDELAQAFAAMSRAEAQGEQITLAQAQARVQAASAASQQTDATRRLAEETERLVGLAGVARKALATQAEGAPGRAEQEAIRQLREQTSNAERTAQRDAERGQRTLEERARSLQDAAEKGRDALQNLRDAAADARGELEALAKVKVQGTAEQENRVFGLGTRAAQDQLVIEQARLARLQARQQGLPRPPVDRAAIRAAARDQVVAEQEAKVAELQGRTTIAPAQRAVDQALNPPQELPAGDLLARARVARAAVTRVEGQSELDFQRRQREAEARVRSQEREAQAKQREAQDQSRADALRLQGIRDTNQALIDEAENKAKSAELDRQRIAYEQQYQAILDAREAQAKAGVPLEEIDKKNPLPLPPSQGAAPAIAAAAAAKGITLTIPPEFSTAAGVQNDAAKLQSLAAEYQATAAPKQTDAAVTQAAAAQAQKEASATQQAAADAITMAAVLFGTPPPPPPTALPTVSPAAIAGTGTPQPVSITIAPGAIDVDVHTTGEVDGAALGEQVAQAVFTEIRTQFGNTPETESAGARYGRGG